MSEKVLIFKKERMMKRLVLCGLVDKIDDDISEIMNKIDGKTVIELESNHWLRVVENWHYAAADKTGKLYQINLEDCELVKKEV